MIHALRGDVERRRRVLLDLDLLAAGRRLPDRDVQAERLERRPRDRRLVDARGNAGTTARSPSRRRAADASVLAVARSPPNGAIETSLKPGIPGGMIWSVVVIAKAPLGLREGVPVEREVERAPHARIRHQRPVRAEDEVPQRRLRVDEELPRVGCAANGRIPVDREPVERPVGLDPSRAATRSCARPGTRARRSRPMGGAAFPRSTGSACSDGEAVQIDGCGVVRPGRGERIVLRRGSPRRHGAEERQRQPLQQVGRRVREADRQERPDAV